MSNMRQLTIEMPDELYQRFIGLGSPAQVIEDLINEVHPISNEDASGVAPVALSDLSWDDLKDKAKSLGIAYHVGMKRVNLESAVKAKS